MFLNELSSRVRPFVRPLLCFLSVKLHDIAATGCGDALALLLVSGEGSEPATVCPMDAAAPALRPSQL